MKLNELRDNPGARKPRKRLGRGIGSGLGKTSGRGMKGQKSRSGVSIKGFEGGQMPIFRRLPKRGFHNPFKKRYAVINTGGLQAAIDAGRIDPGQKIDSNSLIAGGLVTKIRDGVRLLAKGDLKTKVDVSVSGASKAAIEAVNKAGGNIEILGGEKAAEGAADS